MMSYCGGGDSCPLTFPTCVGIDELLARHIAHLFVRDPVTLFSEKVQQDIDNESDHFEVGGWVLGLFV